jgi:hypothetical protein
VLLTVVGLALWALYRVQAGSEAHSYAPGAIAPDTVHLTKNHSYHLSIPGGVISEAKLNIDSSVLGCTIAPAGGAAGPLTISPEGSGSKAINQIAGFVAPFTGRVHITCAGLPPVFVDDADNAEPDLSGLWLVLATIALVVGLPMMLSVLRRPSRPRRSAWSDSGSAGAVGEDEEIEGLVDRARRRADDREVGDTDGRDVGP